MTKQIIFAGLILLAGFLVWQQLGPNNQFKINTNRLAVIKEIQQLQRLETASYTIEKIIDASTNDKNIFQSLLFGDQILLVAHGKVVAGINLENLTENDITIEGNKIILKLPNSEIFHTMLDEQATSVYDRRQGLLSKGNKDLETEARQAAQDSIRQAACEGGILQEAANNAQKQLTTLLKSFGFEQVEVQVKAGSC